MQIITLLEPFPHYIVHDFFTESELSGIWNEIEYLHRTNSFKDKERTGDPVSNNKIGIILDQHYESDRSKSFILNAYSKLFKLGPYLSNKHLYNFVMDSNNDTTYLSYYLNNSEYKPHTDFSVMSAVYTLWKEPKQFSGGDLHFPNDSYTPELRSNSLIIFPSHQLHGVTKVTSDDSLLGSSRYSISKFILKTLVNT
jgi:Rps23 Pro-64 3,4-dihydroxylase Tpa1-like proline 4-hydroxylase